MQQTLVTMGAMEKWGFWLFSVQSPGMQGHFYDQSPAKSPAQVLAGKCEITPVGFNME